MKTTGTLFGLRIDPDLNRLPVAILAGGAESFVPTSSTTLPFIFAARPKYGTQSTHFAHSENIVDNMQPKMNEHCQ